MWHGVPGVPTCEKSFAVAGLSSFDNGGTESCGTGEWATAGIGVEEEFSVGPGLRTTANGERSTCDGDRGAERCKTVQVKESADYRPVQV